MRDEQPLFKLRDRVRITSDPSRRGRILDVKPLGGSFDYFVSFGEHESWFPERALESLPDNHLRWRNRDAFLRDLVIAKLRYPLTDSLYSYRASRTLFEPYQFRPALKFLKNPDQRILIADEVGLGKTIEAAIIYLELKARLNISRVLVLCPSRLRTKWHDELLNRFEEKFSVLDASGVRKLIDDFARFGNQVSIRAIVSYETLRRDEFIDALIEKQLALDLLIVDEAHYMRNAETATYHIGEALANSADAAVFLTATPLHLRNRDLYNLLNLLAPGDFSDPDLFEEQVLPNLHINRAAQLLAIGDWDGARLEIERVQHTLLRNHFIGNPFYDEVVSAISSPTSDLNERIRLQRKLLDLNTLSAVLTRTRKREVAHAAVRAAHSVVVELSPEEMAFYSGVLEHVRDELKRSGKGAPGFAIMMRERQAASCLIATRELFEDSARVPAKAHFEIERNAYDLADIDDDEHEYRALTTTELVQLSRAIGPKDSKFDLFDKTLRQALAESPTSKALVFSTFRRTLDYLHHRLKTRGYEVDVIHGGIDIPTRQQIIDRFRTEPEFRVLLSSEVGAEGLDFQFCDVLMNYDLPWNPMQVEQRIGRLDRFGQQHERIRIFNFYIESTIESRIFQRLYDRINIFQHSIGDLEAILGEEIRSLSRQVLQKELTPAEQERVAEEAARRIVRRQLEAEELDRQKDSLLGQDVIFNAQVTEAVKSGRVIHPEEVRALVQSFLTKCFDNIEFTRDVEEPCWTLTVTEALATYLLPFTQNGSKSQMGSKFREALGYYKQIALTFDSEYARQRQLLEFVTWQHVLAQAALEYWKEQLASEGGIPATRVTLHGPQEETGSGYFFVYALDEYSVNRKRTLETIVVLDDGRIANETSANVLAQILTQTGAPANLEHDEDSFIRAQQEADEWIASKRDSVEYAAINRNEALIRIRSASIDASFDAKIRRTQQLLDEAYEPRIQRLRTGELRNLEIKRLSKLQELQQQATVTTSYNLVALGRVLVVPSPDTQPVENPVSVQAEYQEASPEPILALIEGPKQLLTESFGGDTPQLEQAGADTAEQSDLTASDERNKSARIQKPTLTTIETADVVAAIRDDIERSRSVKKKRSGNIQHRNREVLAERLREAWTAFVKHAKPGKRK